MSYFSAEPEYEQAYNDLASALSESSHFTKYPAYRTALRVVAIPERVIQSRVIWENDKHEVEVNRGYRVQFNSSLGPYKGGTRFHPTVNLSVLKTGKGANAGGSAVSGLEMTQNSQRVSWSAEQVDDQLKGIMSSCFNNGVDTAMEYVDAAEGELPSLLAGSNIAGFCKIVAAMHAECDWW